MTAKEDAPLQKIVESSKGSVVCLKTKFIGLPIQSGSGFFVAPDKIATNIHIIEGAPNFKIKAITAKQLDIGKTPISKRISQAVHNLFHRLFRGLNRQPKQSELSKVVTAHTVEGVVGCNDKNDLVLLKVAETGTPLPFGDIGALENGEQVYIVGYDKGIAGTITSKHNKNKAFEIKIKVPPTQVDGHSGGPVLNSKGEVIGVFVSLREPGSNNGDGGVHSFANVIPLAVLERVLANSGQVEHIAEWRKRPQIHAYTETNLGNIAREAGKLKKAIEHYNVALLLNPNLVDTYLKRGEAKRELGDFRGAIKDYNNALKLNPRDACVYSNRGITKRELGDFRGAVKDYDKAIKLSPEHTGTYINRATAKCYLDDFEGAIKDYDKAITLDPEYTAAYNSRGIAKYYLDDFEGAIEDCDNAIQLNPEDADSYNIRATAKREFGQSKTDQGDMEAAHVLYEAAIADWTEALRLKSEPVPIYNERGWAKYLLGKLETEQGNEMEAQRLFQEAVSDGDEALRLEEIKNATYRSASYHTRGAAKAALGDHSGAIEDFSECIQLIPEKALYYHDRGLSKKALEQHEAAEADFAKAKELDPDA